MATKLNTFNKRIYWSSPCASLDRPVIGIICGSNYTFMFDACSSTKHANEISKCITELNIRKPNFIGISHSHTDHWFGLHKFSAPSMCSKKCMNNILGLMNIDWSRKGYHTLVEEGKGSIFLEKILNTEYGEKRTSIKLKAPTILFKNEIVFDLGDIHIVLKEIKTSHSNDSIYGYVPEEKLVFLGDILYLKNESETEIERILGIMKKTNAKYFIDSHVDKVMSYKEMEKHYRKYYNEEIVKGTS